MRMRSVLSHTAQAGAEGAVIALLVVGLAAGTTFAAKPSPGGGGGGHHGGSTSCTVKAPLVNVDNTWAWGQPGSFSLAGQQRTFAIDVINYDVGCASSTFTVTMAAPAGFSVSMPTNSISLKASSSGYVWTTVTSPGAIADGNYALTVTATRSGASFNSAVATTYYKVYSTDTVAPTVYWPNPGDATTITSGSYNFSVSSNDDHSVKSIEVDLDGAYRSTTTCDGVSYSCQLYYTGSVAAGQHTATFKSSDWLGNVGVLTVSFTAN